MAERPIADKDLPGKMNDVLRRLRELERVLNIPEDEEGTVPLQTYEDGNPLGDTLGINFAAGVVATLVGDRQVEVTTQGCCLCGVTVLDTAGSGEYTPPADAVALIVECIGGGAGGGGAEGAAGQTAGGGGGGGGGNGLVVIDAPGSSYSYAVGASGAGGAAGNNPGTDGGTTSFGSPVLCSSTGGTGGIGGAAGTTVEGRAGGSGGAGTVGDSLFEGSWGTDSLRLSASAGNSGHGGGAARGGGMVRGHTASSPAAHIGLAGRTPGGGGAGALVVDASSAAGGAGANGAIIIYEYCGAGGIAATPQTYVLDGADHWESPDYPLFDNGLVLHGTSWMQTPDTPVLDITGDTDVRSVISLDNPTPSATQIIAAKWGIGTSNSWQFSVVLTSGLLRFAWTDTGTTPNHVENSSVAPTLTAGEILAVRVYIDVNNGAGDHVVRFFTKSSNASTAAADAESDSGWIQLGTDQSAAGPTTTSIFSGMEPVTVGALSSGGAPLTGKVFATVIKDGINGTTVASPNFAAQTQGTQSFVDSAGRTWTGMGGYDITGDIDLRAAAALTDWTPDTDQTLIRKIVGAATDVAYKFYVDDTTDFLVLDTSPNGTTLVTAASTVAPTVSNGALLLIRVTRDVDNGAGGNATKFYTKSSTPATALVDSDSNSGWTQLGSTVTLAGTTSIFSSSAPLTVGGSSVGTDLTTGSIYAAVVKNGIDGTAVANPDFYNANAVSFVDAVGNEWTKLSA